MNFKLECRFCHQSVTSANYSCSCMPGDWTGTYRTLDVHIPEEYIRQAVSASFYEYSFFHPNGMLQHGTLPYKSYVEERYPTVGLTPLYKLDYLSRNYGASVYLKNEGFNPSGCFKDRETMMCLLNSRQRGVKKAVIYSSGNAAASAALLTDYVDDFQLLAFVAGDTYPEKIDYIRNHGADVVVIGDGKTSFETGYQMFAEINRKKIFDEHGYDNWAVINPFRVQGDKTIALEIIKQLSSGKKGTRVPDYVLIPTANGSCMAGIWKGFKELMQAGLITKYPKMVSVGIKNANPVYRAVQQGQTDHPVRCSRSSIEARDAEVGSVLVAEEGYDSIEAAKAVIESGGNALELHASDIEKTLVDFLECEGGQVEKHKLLPEPAALTSLAAIQELQKKVALTTSDVVVSVSTGDALKAEKEVISLLPGRHFLQQKVRRILDEKKSYEHHTSSPKGVRMNTEAETNSLMQSFLQLQT